MIRRIEVLNYRCLRYVSQPLQDFHVLVGPNASGKSTFLDVLGLIRDLLTRGLDDAVLAREDLMGSVGRARRVDELIFNQRADQFELAIELEIPDELRNPKAGSYYQIARYELAIGKDSESGELTIVNETLWLCPEPVSRNTSQASLFPNESAPPASVLTERARKGRYKVISKSESGHHTFNSETRILSTSSALRVGFRRSALANLPQDEKHFPVALWVQNLLMEGIHVLALNSAAMRRPASPSVPARISHRWFKSSLLLLEISVIVMRMISKTGWNTFAPYCRTCKRLMLLNVQKIVISISMCVIQT